MNYHIPIGYILNTAFGLSVGLEGKREIDIVDLYDFYNCLATKMTHLFKDPYFIRNSEIYMETIDSINFDINFDINELTSYIEANVDIYSFDGKIIKMLDKVSYKELESLISLEDFSKEERWIAVNLSTYLGCDIDAIRTLKLTKFQKVFDAWTFFEMIVEGRKTSINSLESEKMNDESILKIRKFFISKFNLSLESTYPFRQLDSVIKKASYIKTKIMDYRIYKSDEQDAIFDIAYLNNWNFLSDRFIIAILTRDFLLWNSMEEALLDNKPNNYDMLIEKEFAEAEEDTDEPSFTPVEGWEEYLERKSQEDDFYDETEEEYDEEFDEDDDEEIIKFEENSRKCLLGKKVFILKFLENADLYLSKHQDNIELQEAIARVIFVDDGMIPIKKKEERALALKSIQDYSFDNIEYNYSTTGLYLIDDIFRHQNPDKLFTKILFIKTANQLFPNKEYVDAFEQYKNHPKYSEYFELIFEDFRDIDSKRKRDKNQ